MTPSSRATVGRRGYPRRFGVSGPCRAARPWTACPWGLHEASPQRGGHREPAGTGSARGAAAAPGPRPVPALGRRPRGHRAVGTAALSWRQPLHRVPSGGAGGGLRRGGPPPVRRPRRERGPRGARARAGGACADGLSKPDLVAPGVGDRVHRRPLGACRSPYVTMSGTSAASPAAPRPGPAVRILQLDVDGACLATRGPRACPWSTGGRCTSPCSRAGPARGGRGGGRVRDRGSARLAAIPPRHRAAAWPPGR